MAELTLATYCPPGFTSAAELREVFDGLLALDVWPRRFDGGPDAVAALKQLTSELIGRFCHAAQRATRPPGAPPLTRYAAGLTVPRRQRLECALLKAVTDRYVMARRGPPRPASGRSSRAGPGRAGRGARHAGPGVRRPFGPAATTPPGSAW